MGSDKIKYLLRTEQSDPVNFYSLFVVMSQECLPPMSNVLVLYGAISPWH